MGDGEYSVETKNRFQLILDDDEVDVYDILKEEEAKSEKKKVDQELNKNVKNTKNEKKDKSKKVGQKSDNANVTNIKNTNGKTSGNGRGNENRPPRMRQNEFQKVDDFEKAPSSQDQQQGGFGGRGMRRGGSAGFRGGRGGRGGGPRRFDRHSGSERTGVKAVEKKEGFGRSNWGGEIDSQLDTSAQEDGRGELGERTAADGEETTINAENDGAEVDAEAAEPEVKEMTLDEWKAAQASSRTKQQFNVRRAGEGEDPKQWKKTVTLEPRKRAESTESYEEEDEDLHEKIEDTRSTLNKLNIQIKFSDNSSRGSPGGRGGGRGRGRGFGGPRSDRPPRSGGFDGRPPRRGRGDYGGNRFNPRQESSALRVDNESEFPSLGSK